MLKIVALTKMFHMLAAQEVEQIDGSVLQTSTSDVQTLLADVQVVG